MRSIATAPAAVIYAKNLYMMHKSFFHESITVNTAISNVTAAYDIIIHNNTAPDMHAAFSIQKTTDAPTAAPLMQKTAAAKTARNKYPCAKAKTASGNISQKQSFTAPLINPSSKGEVSETIPPISDDGIRQPIHMDIESEVTTINKSAAKYLKSLREACTIILSDIANLLCFVKSYEKVPQYMQSKNACVFIILPFIYEHINTYAQKSEKIW